MRDRPERGPDIRRLSGQADSALVNRPMAVGILFLLGMYVTMVYGPIAAAPVEMFPTNIRYTSMSLPYHIGNGWLGGHSLRHGRGHGQYLLVVALVTVVVGFLFIKDRKDVDLQD